MGIITFKFKNFCAFFTSRLASDNELMVGLPDLSDFYDVPETKWHTPRITITSEKSVLNPNGESITVKQITMYEGFDDRRCGQFHGDSIFGDIRLDVPEEADNITADASAADILDIEDVLYHGTALDPDPLLCKARFHFRNGVLSGTELEDVNFADTDDITTPVLNGEYAVEAELRVAIPEAGYAVLRFLNSDAADFVFLGEREYMVTIDNAPPPSGREVNGGHEGEDELHENHFRYYYKIMRRVPVQQFEPMDEPETPSGDPFCMIGGFGGADFPSAYE